MSSPGHFEFAGVPRHHTHIQEHLQAIQEHKLVSRCASLLGALVARWHVNDPPAWCGAASTTLCGGRRPLLCGQAPLVELGIKVTAVIWSPRERLDCWEAIVFVSASTT